MRIPHAMASCCKITSPPRIRRGVSSAMNTGTIIEDAPTASPVSTRKAKNHQWPGEMR